MTKVNKPKSFPWNNERLKEAAKKLNAIESNKPKLFEDYVKEDAAGNWQGFSGIAMRMLDALANKIFDLEKDNDLLRGQITELTHKMDFLMENSISSKKA